MNKKNPFFLCSGGISDNLQDKRKKFQNKRKNPITDSSELKKFPCKKFRKVSSGTGFFSRPAVNMKTTYINTNEEDSFMNYSEGAR